MVVKSKLGRRRYIAFLVISEKPLSKGAIVSRIREIELENFGATGILYPVGFNGKILVLRAPHKLKDNVIELVKNLSNIYGIRVTVFPILTSGTIKTLIKKLQDAKYPVDNLKSKRRQR